MPTAMWRAREPMPDNPYAPPTASSQGDGLDPTGVRREGDQVVWRLGAGWPDRCLRCNGPVARRYRRNLHWHAPGWYLTILLGPILYIIVALIVRRSTRIEVGLCGSHADARTNRLLAAWGAFVIGIIGMVSGCSSRASAAQLQVLGGALLVLAGLVAVAVVSPLVRPVRIDHHEARAAGIGAEYLAGLDSTAGAPWRF